MKILNFFKKKKPKKKEKLGREAKTPPEIEVKKEKGLKWEAPRPKGKISALAYRILKEPHITEKATDLAKENQYIFKVYSRTNKIEIKKAIEDLYGVDVLSVKIIKIPQKRRRLGRITGWRKGYKKAIVRIKEGQKIEVLPR